MINDDATGLVAYRFAVAAIVSQTTTFTTLLACKVTKIMP